WQKRQCMVQRSVISPTTRAATPAIFTRWMRHFFTEDVSPDNRPIVELQQRAVWIGLALILQALNEIDHDWYIPYLMPFGSLIPLALILGSFVAIALAFRPHRAKQQAPPHRWQRILLVLPILLTIAGSLEGRRGIVMSSLPPQLS